ncbi:phosphoserine aminotransferase apoenzyme [Enhydrobacter aerosaccus]|uniref:phosphoserine transaminase n=1 Tax=Enhydrobacter aerosaccus TaxID=225324 RepID=A0A1T4KAC8_9HYPH|nr:phosphoserine transaminase [Enhydrobacter aerosaccus]SJZ39273.1 phosphoserine aminotransferase apoenzyme [Enhydrobacter aerosaccus]
MKPTTRPARPDFSSGPCAKRPGWTPEALKDAAVGRSHRSKLGKKKIAEALDRTRAILGIPADYKVGIVPASDTGAVEMALWSLLGGRPVDMLAWESFGEGWVTDVVKQLKLKDARILKAGYGQIADLKAVDWTHDVVFTWNGTTSGVKVPNGDWIADDRDGLAICDATSAVFAMDLPWQKLDVVTWSWQKVMGGEGAHGMLVLSPRAVKRLESYSPPWPLPKIFRLTSGGKFSEAIFKGDTINTPSLLCVEDAIDGLRWGESVGGLKGLMARSNANLGVLEKFAAERTWIGFLAADKAIRSNTSVCLNITAPWFTALPADKQAAAAKKMADLLETEKAGYDLGSYRDAPPGLRIWCGATVEKSDLEALLPWLDWAYAEIEREFGAKAA